MTVIHIENSYNTWRRLSMKVQIDSESVYTYDIREADVLLNRSYESMYLEWWLHNIGYWLTLPFVKNEKIKKINERFKHVDLERWGEYKWEKVIGEREPNSYVLIADISLKSLTFGNGKSVHTSLTFGVLLSAINAAPRAGWRGWSNENFIRGNW